MQPRRRLPRTEIKIETMFGNGAKVLIIDFVMQCFRKLGVKIKAGLLLVPIVMFSLFVEGASYVGATEQYTPEHVGSQGIIEVAKAEPEKGDEEEVNDPLEPVNRVVFKFNEFFQSILLRPIANLYNENLPAVFRSGVSNFLNNIATPVTVANQILQGNPEEAVRSVGRFMVNSSLGIGGIVDAAAELGDPGRDEDFGQTLGVWGTGEGFYLVLPIFGPSNPRDAIGKFLVDSYFDPVGQWIENTNQTKLYWSQKVIDGISEYADVVDELDQMKKTSVDYYAVIRSLYRQKRNSEISNGELIDIPAIPDLGYDFEPRKPREPIANVVK